MPDRLLARRLPTRPPLGPADQLERIAHQRAVHDEEHLVAGEDAHRRVQRHLLVVAVDGDDAHLAIGVARAELRQRARGHLAARRHAHRHQVGAALRELQHLQRLGVLDQLVHVARDRGLGADHLVHREAFLGQQRVAIGELLRAQPCDRLGDAEAVVRDLAGHQVGGIVGRAGDEQVGVLGAGLGLHRRLRAVAHHAAHLDVVLQDAQPRPVGVDHRDVVLLRRQCLGHALANAARAQNDDLHAITRGAFGREGF
jgi:hypothetical protein